MRTVWLVRVALVVVALSVSVGASAQWSITWHAWQDDGTNGGYWSAGQAGATATATTWFYTQHPNVSANGAAMAYYEITEWCPAMGATYTTDQDAWGDLSYQHLCVIPGGATGLARTKTVQKATHIVGNKLAKDGGDGITEMTTGDDHTHSLETGTPGSPTLSNTQNWGHFPCTMTTFSMDGFAKLFIRAYSEAEALYPGQAYVQVCETRAPHFHCHEHHD